MNNTTLNTSENIPQKTDNDNNLKQQQQDLPSTTKDASTAETKLDENIQKPKPRRRKKKGKKQDESLTLSDDSKHRAQILLERLAQAIENRSKQVHSNHIHPHSSFLGIEHYKDDQLPSHRLSIQSPDPFTNKLPPKTQQPSSPLKKNLYENNNTTANDTS